MTEQPMLALMPGMDGTGDLFGPLLQELPATQPAIVIRYPLTPASYAELLEDALSQLPRSTPIVLVAESFSGPLAVSLAARLPNLCGLVLCASFLCSPLRTVPNTLLSWAATPLARLPVPPFVIGRLLLDPSAPPEINHLVSRTIKSVPDEALAARLKEIAQVNVLPAAEHVDRPVLYIRATRDRLVGRHSADVIAKAFPNVTIVDVEGPHLVLQRAPSASAKVILNFCSKLS